MATVTAYAHGDPHHLRGMQKSAVLHEGPAAKRSVTGYGFWLFLLSDIVMFSCFFASYALLAADGRRARRGRLGRPEERRRRDRLPPDFQLHADADEQRLSAPGASGRLPGRAQDLTYGPDPRHDRTQPFRAAITDFYGLKR